jgi:tetratricopeptide (TPR) repeat protein
VEPRLTGAAWRPCPEGKCAAANVAANCDEIVEHRQALRMLTTQPRCIDTAIAALERFGAASDVAAAYYVRGRQEDRPDDLLRAFDAVEQPTSWAAWFNRALAAESLGLTAEAIDSWSKAADDSQWAAEALEHRARLLREVDAATKWTRIRAQLPHADLATTARLIAPFHASAERYVEEELLPQSRLDEARRIGTALVQLSGDRFLMDVVNVPAPDAYKAFAEARRVERSFSNAAAEYEARFACSTAPAAH